LENMGMIELLRKHKEEELLEKGMEKGIENAMKITDLYRAGHSVEYISEAFKIDVQKVQMIIDKLLSI